MKTPSRGAFVAVGLTFNSVKVFSGESRAQVDRLVEAWLRAHPSIHLVEVVVTESTTHIDTCVCITLFFHAPALAVIEQPATTN